MAQNNGRSDSFFRQKLNITENDFVILFVGRVHPIKGLETICDAVKTLVQKDSRIRFVIVGDGDAGYVSQLKQNFHELVTNKHIIFAVYYNDEEKADAYQSSDVFSLMSQSENFGLAIAEAMSHGLPVIVSKGCPWHQLIEWDAGFWIDADSDKIAAAISVLLEDQDGRVHMGERAKISICSYLDTKILLKQIINLYEEIINTSNNRNSV